MAASLSIIIPAYNESVRLAKTLRIMVAYLCDSWPGAELILVDDGSTDQTAALARETFADAGSLRTSVISYKSNLGKGRAVRLGLLAARGDVALFSDADLSTPITETPKLVDPIMRGECDLTFGSRALDRNLIGVHQPWRREQGGRIFNMVVRLATGLPFWDTQCGFKAFKRPAALAIFPLQKIERWGFDPEILFLARKLGFKVKEIPVVWGHSGGTRINPLVDGFRMFTEMLRVRWYSLTGKYDATAAQTGSPRARLNTVASRVSLDAASSCIRIRASRSAASKLP